MQTGTKTERRFKQNWFSNWNNYDIGLIFENDLSHGHWRWMESNHNWLKWGCDPILNGVNTGIIVGWGPNRSLNQQKHPHVSRLKAEFNKFKYDCKRNWNLTCTWTFKLNVKIKLDEIEHKTNSNGGSELAQWLVFCLEQTTTKHVGWVY